MSISYYIGLLRPSYVVTLAEPLTDNRLVDCATFESRMSPKPPTPPCSPRFLFLVSSLLAFVYPWGVTVTTHNVMNTTKPGLVQPHVVSSDIRFGTMNVETSLKLSFDARIPSRLAVLVSQ